MILYTDRTTLFPLVSKMLPHSRVLLDIGAGIRPSTLISNSLHLAVEPFSKYIDYFHSKTCNAERKIVYINTDWSGIFKILPSKSVDTIICMDVIEHLEKDEGYELIQKTIDYFDPNYFVIFTPLGFIEQCHPDGIDNWGIHGGGRFQEHKSGWHPSDFPEPFIRIVCQDFHERDNGLDGAAFHGAFFAIYQKHGSRIHSQKLSNREG